mmetsp:Transcript_108297/g.345355  ORF Transcript_108297/g.345355 Transcript_108297/m.345355 type:complete len:212 (+) Transcript_108297:36-671(+)
MRACARAGVHPCPRQAFRSSAPPCSRRAHNLGQSFPSNGCPFTDLKTHPTLTPSCSAWLPASTLVTSEGITLLKEMPRGSFLNSTAFTDLPASNSTRSTRSGRCFRAAAAAASSASSLVSAASSQSTTSQRAPLASTWPMPLTTMRLRQPTAFRASRTAEARSRASNSHRAFVFQIPLGWAVYPMIATPAWGCSPKRPATSASWCLEPALR